MILNPEFKSFNPHAAVRIYYRNLPHWRQEGCTYFVTFGLADAIPKSVLLQWQDERQNWLTAHGIDGSLPYDRWRLAYLRIPERDRLVFQRTQRRVLFMELDQSRGSCLLRKGAARQIVADALRFFHAKRCWCGDFVVMPNHVHWLVSPMLGNKLERILSSIKGFTSTQLTKSGLKQPGRLWRKENYDHIVRGGGELRAIRKYIGDNPMKARCGEQEYSLYQAPWLDE